VIYLAPLVVLLLLHATIEFAYAALANARRTALRERAEEGDRRAARILSLIENIGNMQVMTRVALTLIRFSIAAVVSLNIAEPLAEANVNVPGTLFPWFVYAVILLSAALVTYILGTLIPASLGSAYGDQLVGLASTFLRALMLLLSPLTALMLAISRAISRLSGSEALAKSVTEEEIMSLVDVGQQGGTIEDDEKEMIYSVLQFGETLVREVMVPRPDVTAVEVDAPLTEALAQFIASGHSRIPVYEESIDKIKGMLYAKDLLPLIGSAEGERKTIRELMRPAYFVPETKRADKLFQEMQERKIHIAVIVDEYGGTSGLVTIEDLIEEIVGDIRDEYDIDEESDYVRLGELDYLIDGSMNLDDLNALLESHFSTDESDSIGGWIYNHLGRVPDQGEVIETDNLKMRVEKVDNRRIRKIFITRVLPPEPTDANDEKPEADEPTPPNGTARPLLTGRDPQVKAAQS
jgi:CBS domain containing-hemolysin-like protein